MNISNDLSVQLIKKISKFFIEYCLDKSAINESARSPLNIKITNQLQAEQNLSYTSQHGHSVSIPQTELQASPNLSFLIGLSGGLDSVVLLHLLVVLKKRLIDNKDSHLGLPSCMKIVSIRAIYIHHGLSPNADAWALHCQNLCDELGVEFHISYVQINKKDGGIEASARKARYDAFERHIRNQEILLTAQHLDDQAETFLLALKRGSGPCGLSAMPPVKRFAKHYWHARPLLDITRETLRQYAVLNHLSWIEDESNLDDRYDRNFLRLNIIPQLQNKWPSINHAIVKSAALCFAQETLLEELLTPTLLTLINSEDESLAIEPILSFSDEKRDAILRMWCRQMIGISPSFEQLRRMWDEVALSRLDSQATVEILKDMNTKTALHIKRYKKRLYCVRIFDNVKEIISKPLDLEQGKEINLPWLASPITIQTILNDLDKQLTQLRQRALLSDYQYKIVNGPVSIHFGLSGSTKLDLLGHGFSKTLKNLWQAYDIPPWKREQVPFVFVDNKLLMAITLFTVRIN